MFEIGSEFWTVPNEKGSGLKSLVPQNTNVIYTLCGRTALDIVITDILTQKHAETVYMPSYCCHTMIEPFLRNGIEVEFYDVVATDEGIKCDLRDNCCDVVFLIDYFGFIDSGIREFAKKEKAKGKAIIYDMTHAMFCENQDYSIFDYVFGSFRKWIGINAGFAAKNGKWTKEPILKHNFVYEKLRNDSFDLKAEYIRNPKSVDKKKFLSAFQLSEEILETDYQHYEPDERSNCVLNELNIEKIRRIRRRNAELLMTGLERCSKVVLPYKSIKPNECPLFVPIMIKKERDTIRNYLINRSIYMPIHWPISEMHRLKTITRQIYELEVSCVCDQRYSENDMHKIVDILCMEKTGEIDGC